jgi:antitoxin (DNA-binding transcriptional repressor) of toxin-antitoxin stability system
MRAVIKERDLSQNLHQYLERARNGETLEILGEGIKAAVLAPLPRQPEIERFVTKGHLSTFRPFANSVESPSMELAPRGATHYKLRTTEHSWPSKHGLRLVEYLGGVFLGAGASFLTSMILSGNFPQDIVIVTVCLTAVGAWLAPGLYRSK